MTHSAAPCYGCEDRKLYCRSGCPKWSAWQEEEARFKEAVSEAKRKENASWAVLTNRHVKNLRRAVHNRTRGRRAY